MAGGASIRAGSAFVELFADDSKLQAGFRRAQARLKSFSTACNDIGKNMLALSAAMSVPMVLSVKTFVEFDDKMRMVKGVTQATGKEFESLTELAKKLGRETSFTASQVAEGMTELGRMGFKPDEIEKAIPAVMNLSRATGTGLAEAATIAANNLRVFQMQASQTGDVADILTATANNSAQTLTDLGEALKMAGPKAAEAGQDLRETCVQLGILANMGIRGSMAGTALSRTFQQMATGDTQALLQRYGVAATDSSGRLRRMRDILSDLARASANLPSAEKIELFQSVFDIRGSLGGGVLTSNIGQLDAMTEALDNCAGVAAKTAKEMDSGLGGAFRNLSSAAEGLRICLGEVLNNSLVPLIRETSNLCLSLREWLKIHPELAIALTYATAGIASFSVGLIALGMTVKAFSGTLTVLSVGIKGVALAMTLFTASNPIGWAILAAGAIAGLCIYIERLGAETRKTSDAMSELMAKNDSARELDMQRAERLKQLSEKQSLTNAEYVEAGTLMKDLEGKYGSFGAVLDTVSKKIDFAAKAQANLNEKMAAAKIADIDATISEKKKNVEIAKGYNDTMSSYWYRANRPWDEIASFWGGGTAGRIQQNGEYINGKGGQLDQIGSLQQDRRKWEGFLKTGKLPSVSGNKPGPAGNSNSPADSTTGGYLSIEDRAKTEEAVKKTRDQLARKRRTDLENEIADIQAMTDEYKKLLKTLLEYEKARPGKLRNNARIAELESWMSQADKDRDVAIRQAQGKETDKFEKQQRKEVNRFTSFEEGRKAQREKEDTDRKVDAEFKKSKDQGIEYLQKIFQGAMQSAASALADYQSSIKTADADGKRTGEEQETIDKKYDEYQRRIGTADDYRRRLEDARAGTAGSMEKIDVAGSFFVNQIQTVKGAGSIGEKQLSVQEKIAKNTDETAREVKKIKTGVVTTA